MAPAPRILQPQDPLCAYLDMEMQIAKATPGFGETVGLHSLGTRKFEEIVSPNDREKVARLQRGFEEERREREPNYLPPIYLAKFEEDRMIQTIAFSPEETSQVRMDRLDVFTFQGLDGQQRAFNVRFGLAKKDSTYFIVLQLQVPQATPQPYHQPSPSQFSRESYSQASQYGYPSPQHSYPINSGPSAFMASPAFVDARGEMYRTPGPLGPSIPPSGNMPPFAQSQMRPEYSQGQPSFQTPRSELPPAPPQHQRDLQLPPIRDHGSDGSSVDPPRRRDDRSGRVDIGGLLEHPDPARRGM